MFKTCLTHVLVIWKLFWHHASSPLIVLHKPSRGPAPSRGTAPSSSPAPHCGPARSRSPAQSHSPAPSRNSGWRAACESEGWWTSQSQSRPSSP
eukprot:6732039-Pyramimonas_sp.AAC.1